MIKEKYSAEFDFLGFYLPFTIVTPILGIYGNYVFPLLSEAILLIIFSYLYSKVYFSKKWIKTKGEYKKYNLQYIRYIGLLNNYSYDNCCRPYCLYTYKVDGVQYTNDRLSILNKDFLEHEQFKKMLTIS